MAHNLFCLLEGRWLFFILPLCFVRKPSCGLQSGAENWGLSVCSIFRPSQRKEKLSSHLEMVTNKTLRQAICRRPEQLWYVNLFWKRLPTPDLLYWTSNVSLLQLQPSRARWGTSCFPYLKEPRHSSGLSRPFASNYMLFFCAFRLWCLLFCPLCFS